MGGIRLECKDDGPLFDWDMEGEMSSSGAEGEGDTSGFFDINTDKAVALLDAFGDLLGKIFGGEEEPPPGGGEAEPPPGGGEENPPEGEEDPPPGGEEDPPEGEESSGQQGRELVINVAGTTLTRFRTHRPIRVNGTDLVIVPGVYRPLKGNLRLPVKRLRPTARAL